MSELFQLVMFPDFLYTIDKTSILSDSTGRTIYEVVPVRARSCPRRLQELQVAVYY